VLAGHDHDKVVAVEILRVREHAERPRCRVARAVEGGPAAGIHGFTNVPTCRTGTGYLDAEKFRILG